MNEGIKTLVYLGAAGLVAVLAILSRPPVEKFNVREQTGKFLFEKFDDPAKADSMEIVKYDETLGTIEEFRVARDKASGAWTLPKFSGYPADAESRVRDAALLLVDLPIVGVASEVAGDHRMFGVIEPDKEKLKVGDEGVGLLVRFEDAKGQDLASVIVGKKVSGADGHRYVRKVGQDVVYDVKIDPDQLSTKFKDWIDKDLLKMNSWDVENVALKNYSVSIQPPNRVLIDKRFDLTADFKDSEWKLKELKKYRDGEGLVTALSENEELNKEKLNDLKTAVDELEIADVRRKPKGLGADLKAGAAMAKDDEGMVDLMKHGFYMVPMRGSETEFELLSANGEITVGMKEGVEYVLRFGETEEGGQTAEGEGQNRYLFVTTRVDMSKFPQPDLEPVPELPGGAKPEAAKNAAPAAKEAKPEAKPEAKSEAKSEAKPEAKPETSAETTKPSASDETSTAEAAKPAEASPPAADAKPATEAKPAPEAKPAAKEGDAKDAKAETPAKADKEAKESEIEKERERITKENQRKIDERNEKLKKAKEKVAELNTRFADWYYLVSDKQFKKIQLGLDDVIKTNEPNTGVDAFREMQKEGLKKD